MQIHQQHDLLRSFLDERLEKNLQGQEIEPVGLEKTAVCDHLLCRSGELMIALGKRLIGRSSEQKMRKLALADHSG